MEKKTTSIYALLLTLLLLTSFYEGLAQFIAKGAFRRCADVPGSQRSAAVCFVIGTKGYVGTGIDTSGAAMNDFWEFDPANNSWTQKANFSGGARHAAAGFAIGTKGYVGTGLNGTTHYKDLWEYNPISNTWVQKADLPGPSAVRHSATAFAISGRGYLGLGTNPSNPFNQTDLWEYNPTSNSWTQKAYCPGPGRVATSSFVINSDAYVLGGGSSFNDVYKYTPSTNSWSLLFGTLPVSSATGKCAFSIGNAGYVVANGEVWEFEPSSTSWIQRGFFAGYPHYHGIAFAIGSRGYVGAGHIQTGITHNYTQFWEYDPLGLPQWYQGSSNSQVNSRAGSTTFVLGSMLYACGGGNDQSPYSDIMRYDLLNHYWIQNSTSLPFGMYAASAFVLNNKGYIANGYAPSSFPYYKKDLREFDGSSFVSKTNYGGSGARFSVAFAIGNKGYVGLGSDNNNSFSEFWEYNPLTNTWTQKANFGGGARNSAVGISIGTKGYVGTGRDGLVSAYNDWWEYNPATNSWIQKSSLPAKARSGSSAFTIGNKGYIAFGEVASMTTAPDIWEYDPANDRWTYKASLINATSYSIAASFQNSAYLVRGDRMWVYTPGLTRLHGVSVMSTCPGDSIKVYYTQSYNGVNMKIQLSDTSGSFSSPITLATLSAVTAKYDSIKVKIPNGIPGGNRYSLRIVSSVDTSMSTDGIIIGGGSSFSASKPNLCPGDSVVLTGLTGANLQYQWLNNNSVIPGATSRVITVYNSGNYRLLTTNTSSGCTDSSAVKSVVLKNLPKPGFTINNPAQCEKQNNFIFTDTSSAAINNRLWKIGNTDTSSLSLATKSFNASGSYSVRLILSSTDGCTDSLTKTVIVHPHAAIGFNINNSTQCIKDNAFSYTNTSTVSSGSFSSQWWLDVNDTPQTLHAAKSYTSAASYHVILKTTTDKGCKDTLLKNVTVNASPVADFSCDSAQCLIGNSFVMNNTSSGSTLTYAWAFGNGQTATAVNPSVSYATHGFFDIRLISTTNLGCPDTLLKRVRVKPSPNIPSLLYSPDTTVCNNVPVIIKTNSTHSKSWLLNGSAMGNTADSLVINNTPGTYMLRVTNAENCDAVSVALQVSFHPQPPQPVLSISGSLLSSSASAGNQWYNSSGPISGQTGQTFTASAPGNYYTIVTLNGCSSLPSAAQSFPATGAYSLQAKGLVIFPNPNDGHFKIQLPGGNMHIALLKLIDVTGRTVFNQTFEGNNELTVDVNNLANGTYMLQLETPEQIQRARIMISNK